MFGPFSASLPIYIAYSCYPGGDKPLATSVASQTECSSTKSNIFLSLTFVRLSKWRVGISKSSCCLPGRELPPALEDKSSSCASLLKGSTLKSLTRPIFSSVKAICWMHVAICFYICATVYLHCFSYLWLNIFSNFSSSLLTSSSYTWKLTNKSPLSWGPLVGKSESQST